MAGAVGFEPTTNGFGDHYSTVEPYPFDILVITAILTISAVTATDIRYYNTEML